MSRRPAPDPAAHLLGEFDALHDRLNRSLGSPTFSASVYWEGVAKLSRLAATIRDLRAAQVRRAHKARPKPSGPKVTLTRQHLCAHISPESTYRGELRWLGDDERSLPCSGCGQTQWRT